VLGKLGKAGIGEVVAGRKHWRGRRKDKREKRKEKRGKRKDNAETRRALRFAEARKAEKRKDEAELRTRLKYRFALGCWVYAVKAAALRGSG
jgi:hypothetical protein